MHGGPHSTRRRWLSAVAGAVGIPALTGCLDGENDGGEDDGSEGGGDAGVDGDETPPGGSSLGFEQLPGWPMYGANHWSTGHHPEASAPSGDVSVRWAVDPSTDDGAIRSSAVIHDGMVYAGSTGGRVWALRLADGEVEWEYEFRNPYAAVSSAPVYVDGTLYVRGQDLKALDAADGTERWSVPARLTDVPIVHDGGIYVTREGDRPTVERLAPSDGRQERTVELGEGDVCGVPAVDDDTCYVTFADEVVAVDLEAGEVEWRWSHPEGDELDKAGVAYDGQRVYATAGIRTGGNQELPGVFAIDASSGTESWRFTLESGTPLRPAPAVADGMVYVTDSATRALDAESGDLVWERDQPGNAKPTVVDGTVIVRDDSVVAFDAASGDVAWSADAGSPNMSGRYPTIPVSDGVALVATGSSLVALE